MMKAVQLVALGLTTLLITSCGQHTYSTINQPPSDYLGSSEQVITENMYQPPPNQAKPTVPSSADQEVPNLADQMPTEQVLHEQADTTPKDEEQPKTEESILSVSEAETSLRYGWFGEHGRITYIPEMNRQEDGAILYAFSIDYSTQHMNEAHDNYGFAYAWVNSLTRYTVFEEPEMYHNVIDCRFPLPMLEEEVIPYDYFVPNAAWFEGAYWYVGTITIESYQSQLRESCFTEIETNEHGAIVWNLVDWEDGMTLFVHLSPNEELFGITMYIYYGILEFGHG